MSIIRLLAALVEIFGFLVTHQVPEKTPMEELDEALADQDGKKITLWFARQRKRK